MILYMTAEEIKQRNITDKQFCEWVDKLHEICKEEFRWQEYDLPIKLDETACLNAFNDGMPPYMAFREEHFND